MFNHHELCSRTDMSRKFVRMKHNCRNLYQAAWFIHEVDRGHTVSQIFPSVCFGRKSGHRDCGQPMLLTSGHPSQSLFVDRPLILQLASRGKQQGHHGKTVPSQCLE